MVVRLQDEGALLVEQHDRPRPADAPRIAIGAGRAAVDAEDERVPPAFLVVERVVEDALHFFIAGAGPAHDLDARLRFLGVARVQLGELGFALDA